MSNTSGQITINNQPIQPIFAEPAWAPVLREHAELIKKLTARIEELEATQRYIIDQAEAHDREIDDLYCDITLLKYSGEL